jgi:hypothetical protein
MDPNLLTPAEDSPRQPLASLRHVLRRVAPHGGHKDFHSVDLPD